VINSRTEQYRYDEINRLSSVNYGAGGTQQYAFDNMGNRLTCSRTFQPSFSKRESGEQR
jgi:hypothetical protein